MSKKIVGLILAVVVALSTINVSLTFADEIDADGSFSSASINEIIDEMNKVSIQTPNSTKLISLACILKDREDELFESSIISMIQDPANTEVVKVTLIQLARNRESQSDSNYEELYRRLITGDSVSDEIKRNAIWSLPNSTDSIELINSVLDSEAGPLAFQALKFIDFIAPENADVLADRIMLNYLNESTDRIRGAIKIKQNAIENSSSSNYMVGKEKQLFLEQCRNILADSEDEKLTDTIVIALSNLDTVDAIETVLNSSKVSHIMKRYTVDKNQDIIRTIKLTEESYSSLLSKIYLYSGDQLSRAATGFEGYAVYRDGVPTTPDINLDWHGGLMYSANNSPSNCVIHSPGGKELVQNSSWPDFMAKSNNVFKGVYTAKSGLTAVKRENAVWTAIDLRNEDVGYTLWNQVEYIRTTTTNTKSKPSDVLNVRCDGLIEYCYEYQGVRVYGTDDSLWDVSSLRKTNNNHHAGTKITPISQATWYLTRIQTNPPE